MKNDTASIPSLLNEIGEVARAWQAAAHRPADKPHLAAEFNRLLDRLFELGWDDLLGIERELPDDYLPDRYLRRRAERIDRLEDDLARFSEGWRRNRERPEQQRMFYDAYVETMEELFRIGHWSGEPDAESHLPHDVMPRVYKEFWQQR